MKVFLVFLLATVIVSVTLADLKPLWDSQQDHNASLSPQSRIIGGTAAILGQFLYFAHLERRSLLGKVGNCGGSIVHINWVLTAAHCASFVNLLGITVKYHEIWVRAGTLTASGSAEQNKTVSMNNIHIHPEYRANIAMNDIALLKTDSVFATTAYVKPVILVDFGTDPASYVGQFVTASGFGYTTNTGPRSDVLLYTKDLKVISFADCQAQFSPRPIPTSSFCVQDTTTPITASCIGDFGGPVTITISGQKRLCGIISYTSANGCDDAGQGHTNLAQYIT